MLSAIFFDVGQTLCFADFPVILAPLQENGINIPFDQALNHWHDTLRLTKPMLDERHAHRDLHAPDKTYWQMFYEHFLPTVGVAADAPNFVAMREALRQQVRTSAHWNIPGPGTHQVLARLAPRYKLGVISNADGIIEAMLRQQGLTEHMGSIIDSGRIGVEKPHPRIFHTALESLGVAPEESLYIGDIYSVDYQGATAVGMKALLMDAAGVYRNTDYPRIESLLELEGWLEAQGW